MSGFLSHHSYSGLDASPAYEGSASFSRLTSVSRPASGFKNETHASRAEDDGLSSGPSAPRYPSSFTNHQISYASIALIRKTCGFKNETHASRAEDDGLSSGPSAPRYPSSFTNHKINSTPETSKLVSGVSLFYASLILKTLTSFRPCRRRLRALPERVP